MVLPRCHGAAPGLRSENSKFGSGDPAAVAWRPPCCPRRGARAGGSRLLRGGGGEGGRRPRAATATAAAAAAAAGELAPEPEPVRAGGRRAPGALGRAEDMAGSRECSG